MWMKEKFSIFIKAIPAFHAEKKNLSSLVGNGNEYLLTIVKDQNRKTVYVSRDCVHNDKVGKNVLDSLFGFPLDIVIANAGSAMVGHGLLGKIIGRITNNIQDLLKLLSDLHPKILLPVLFDITGAEHKLNFFLVLVHYAILSLRSVLPRLGSWGEWQFFFV